MSNAQSSVIVVDDSKSITEMLVSLIEEKAGTKCRSANDFASAQKLVEKYEGEFYLAILDLHLPDAHNGEIVDYFALLGIPSIVLTGSLSDELRDRILAKNVIDYVIKGNIREIENIANLARRVYRNKTTKVLVVDDSESACAYHKWLLSSYGYQVHVACDGVEALKVIDKHPDIKMVLTDYNMPNMDGMQLIGEIRLKHSREEMCIIAISQQDKGTLSAKLLKNGANDFITRPFLVEEFYCRVNQNIEFVDLVQQMKESANKDFLTGLYNRRYFYEVANTMYNNAKRENINLAVGMIDIDFFKNINDTYGHYVGDLVIKSVSDTLQQHFRSSDVVARLGGEEFCVLATNVKPDALNKVFDSLRRKIERTQIEYDEQIVSVTVSIGLNVSLHENLNDMINSADDALYLAKTSGRNRVELHRPKPKAALAS